MPKDVKVFISSTCNDLKEDCRGRAIDTIDRSDCAEPIAMERWYEDYGYTAKLGRKTFILIPDEGSPIHAELWKRAEDQPDEDKAAQKAFVSRVSGKVRRHFKDVADLVGWVALKTNKWQSNEGGIRPIAASARIEPPPPRGALSTMADRALFVSGSDDGAIRLWLIGEPAENFQITFEGHTNPVSKICFSSSGKLLASRSNDDTVRIWRAPDWRCVVIINVSTSFAGANAYFPVLAFYPGEPLLATCVDRADEISVLEIDEEALINSSSDINS